MIMYKQNNENLFTPLGEPLVTVVDRGPAPSVSRLLTPEVIDAAQEIMTGFGLYLLEKGYDERLADKYADPDTTARRLRSTNASGFVIDGPDIVGYPIDYFHDATGIEYSKAKEETKRGYSRREFELLRLTRKLARLVVDNPAGTDRDLRQQAVDGINSYATHEDGTKEVVNAVHFSASGRNTFKGRATD